MVTVPNSSDIRGHLGNFCRSMNNVTVTTDHNMNMTRITGRRLRPNMRSLTTCSLVIVNIKEFILHQIRPEFDVVFAIDTSGSMAGALSQQTFQAISKIIAFMHLSDRVCIIKFSDEAVCILPLTKKEDISFPECIAAHLTTDKKQFQCSGQTKLWDSTSLGMDILMKRPKGGSDSKPSPPPPLATHTWWLSRMVKKT